MRSYGQLCAVARALDVVGDRWTLLIVRELLIRPRARFTDLQTGLPGVATNLLAQRLHDLQDAGVLRHAAPSTTAGGRAYELTDRGRDLEGVVRELLKWGAATVGDAPPDALFQMHWLGMPARYLLRDHDPGRDPCTVRFGDVDDGFDVTAAAGTVTVDPPLADVVPAVIVAGPGPVLVGLVLGAVSVGAAVRAGVSIAGDRSALTRVLPIPPSRSP